MLRNALLCVPAEKVSGLLSVQLHHLHSVHKKMANRILNETSFHF
jgi:hypothetical protein